MRFVLGEKRKRRPGKAGPLGFFLVDRRNYTEWPLHESCNKAQ